MVFDKFGTSNASRSLMTSRSLKKLNMIFWIILLGSAALFFVFMILESEVYVNLDSYNDLIKDAPDMDRLRNIAQNIIAFRQYTSGTATGLCVLGMGAFLVFMIGAIIGLSMVKEIRSQLTQPSESARKPKAKNMNECQWGGPKS
jgi:hypothetical protein